jgi:hypothetical protein
LSCKFSFNISFQGYVSEAAAYIVDKFFNLNVVPPTAVVGLASKVFNYSRLQRYEARAKQRITSRFPNIQNRFNWSRAYKKKIGSFQTFVHGYMSPEEFHLRYPIDTLTDSEKYQLTIEIQKMFVLDYIIRNTDRLNANYLIKVKDPFPEIVVESSPDIGNDAKEVIIEVVSDKPTSSSTIEQAEMGPSGDHVDEVKERVFSIACIDNGLAFPFKHPSDFRSCKSLNLAHH